MRFIALTAALLATTPVAAIERIRFEAQEVTAAGVGAHQVNATLTLRDNGRSRIDVNAGRLVLPAAITQHTGAITNLRLHCDDPVIREPDFGCPALTASVHAARLAPQALRAAVSLRSDTGVVLARGAGLTVADATLQFDARLDAAGWRLALRLPDVELDALRRLAPASLPLPKDLALSGRSHFEVDLVERAGVSTADVRAQVVDLTFQNAAATWIAEKVGLTLAARLDLRALPAGFDLTLQGHSGQFLGGTVLLDFSANPLQLQAQGTASTTGLQLARLAVTQQQLADLAAVADIGFTAPFLRDARVDLKELRFPAAYASYLQLLLATTPFNQLTTEGSVRGTIVVSNDQPVAVDLDVADVAFSDASRKLKVTGVNAGVHWAAGLTGPPRPSFLEWESSEGWGIVGARTHLDFTTQDRSFRLTDRARLPFFDGALVINTFAVDHFGLETMEGVFDAVIEPISFQLIAKAFEWPEFAGTLSGRIPGLTYKDRLLTLSGNLEAEVFDGRVVASNLRVREPFSAWPRLFADVTARGLDLDLITRTFEFGSITGRLDADLAGLETFNWSPTAFDFRMATPRGDRSRRRISQKAVESLSNIGGGGGGVAAALQGGLLRFFDDFGYARLGLSCRLRNDVCQMDGVGKAGAGYYIVKGSGLPRINIIGNANRVDWPRLVSQISEALGNTDSVVVN